MWSPELAAFLQPDEFGFLSRSGTLWSWPQQNPLRWRDPSGRGAAEDWAGELLDAAAEFAPGPGGAANDNAAVSEVEAAESESPLGLAAGAAATSLGIFADQVQGLAQEMFEQQDADANPEIPVASTDLAGVVQVVARLNSACALFRSGEVRCWGANTRGELGNGTPDPAISDPSDFTIGGNQFTPQAVQWEQP